jgi:hypothetical protein
VCFVSLNNGDNLLIIHLERRTVLRPRFAVIINAGGGDVGVAEPFLHLRDVGLVVERVGGGSDVLFTKSSVPAKKSFISTFWSTQQADILSKKPQAASRRGPS